MVDVGDTGEEIIVAIEEEEVGEVVNLKDGVEEEVE